MGNAIIDDKLSYFLLQMEAEVAAVVEALAAVVVVGLAQLQAMVVVAAVMELLLLAMAVAVTAMDVSLPARLLSPFRSLVLLIRCHFSACCSALFSSTQLYLCARHVCSGSKDAGMCWQDG